MTQRIIGLAFTGFLLMGCSTRTTDVVACTDNLECREFFGTGSICASDGFCETLAANARCTETFPENLLTDPALTASHVIIGSVEERSENIFRSFERAARLAFKQANGRGGIDNLDLGLVMCNIDGVEGQTSREALLETGRYLVNLGVPAIIGPAKSGDAEALFQDLNPSDNPAGVLLISPSATSDDLTSLDPLGPSDSDPGLFWRTAPPDSLQGTAIAVDMRVPLPAFGRDVAVAKAVAIFQEGPYGTNLAQVFAQAFVANGGPLPVTLPFTNATERDTQIANVGSDATVEEVLFISSDTSDTVAFFNEIAGSADYNAKTIFVPDAAATNDVLAVANPARFIQTRGSRPAPLKKNVDLVYAALIASYMTEYNEDIELFSFTANAYDAAWMVGYSVAWAIKNESGVISGKTMAKGLRKISSGPVLQVGPGDWNGALQAFAAGQSFDLDGSSGDLDYDPTDEETSAPTEIWTLTGTTIEGRYTIAAP